MLAQLLDVDCCNSCVVYDAYRVTRRKRSPSDSFCDFCCRDFRTFHRSSDYQSRHLRQADYIRNRSLETYSCDEEKTCA